MTDDSDGKSPFLSWVILLPPNKLKKEKDDIECLTLNKKFKTLDPFQLQLFDQLS